MNDPTYTVSKIAGITHGILHSARQDDPVIRDILIDSRRFIHSDNCLFIALVSGRNNGHNYIAGLYDKGVRHFLVSVLPEDWPQVENGNQNPPSRFKEAVFILVKNTLDAIQQLGAFHRSQFHYPVFGITGSNGKTIVKEWFFQLLGKDYKIIRSPKSYNSQIGVPLSIWKMEPEHQLGIFEAGISMPGEMERLEPIIRPTIGIFTNIGHAHDEHFRDLRQKTGEKLRLFEHADTLIYCADHSLIAESLASSERYQNLKTFTWSRANACSADLKITEIQKENGKTTLLGEYKSEEIRLTIPFIDEASIENAIHCISGMLVLGFSLSAIGPRISTLTAIALRLELKEGINHCHLINDSYNTDINSLSIAIDFLNQQNQHPKKTIILSDILQSGRDKEDLYREIGDLLQHKKIDRVIGIGKDISHNAARFFMQKEFYLTTDDFLQHVLISSFQNETVLLKGARHFEFEKISALLQQKAHETVLEINLDALIHNLNYYRSLLQPGTKIMAMVKAFSYGSGSFEIANLLQFHRVDYLAVAYADEGVELRKAGIHLPIMVMSPEEESLDALLKYNLEPEIYNLRILGLLVEAMERNQTSIQEEVRVHLKIDTGMHRLGFEPKELPLLIERLKQNPELRIQSVFSHLAASEDPFEADFTRKQIEVFLETSKQITQNIPYPVLHHIVNSAGISRFPDAQFDMVRLGIGLYGIGNSSEEQTRLRNVGTLKTVITQIRQIRAGETIGYNRKGIVKRDSLMAIVPIGYADGLNRKLGNGNGSLFIHGQPAPIIGNICMDLTMLDITDIKASGIREGDEVIVFGDLHPVTALARQIDTIPYEVMTGISRRVKRIYFFE